MQANINFRASPVLLARIEELAAARKCTRSAAIKRAILEATATVPAGAVPDEYEVLALLSESARGGNVAAMKELRAYHRERRSDGVPDAVTPLDEMARRRLERLGGRGGPGGA